eukprot:5412883-Karenia_brevis.AAC.1
MRAPSPQIGSSILRTDANLSRSENDAWPSAPGECLSMYASILERCSVRVPAGRRGLPYHYT